MSWVYALIQRILSLVSEIEPWMIWIWWPMLRYFCSSQCCIDIKFVSFDFMFNSNELLYKD